MNRITRILLYSLAILLPHAKVFALPGEISADVLDKRWERIVQSPDFNVNLIQQRAEMPRPRFTYREDGTANIDWAIHTMENSTALDINPFSTNIAPALGELLNLDPTKTNAYCLADELSSLLTLLKVDRRLLSDYAEIATGYEPREECSEQDAHDCQTLYLITRFHQKTGITLDVDAAERLVEIGRGRRKAKGKKSLKMAESIEELTASAIPILREMAFSRVRFLMRGIEWAYFPDFQKDTFVDYWTSDIARRAGFPCEEVRPIVCEGVYSAQKALAAFHADLLAEAILRPRSRMARLLGKHPASTNDAPRWLSEKSGLHVTNTAPLFSEVFSKESRYFQWREVNSWTWHSVSKPPANLASPDFPSQALASLREQPDGIR